MRTFPSKHRSFLFVVLACLLGAVPAWAALTGDVVGRVVDPQGLPVEGAHVSILNLSTGVNRTTDSLASGDFSSLQLDIGTYQLRVEKNGFTAYQLNNIVIQSGKATRVRIELKIGSTNDTVTVQSGAEIYLDATSPQVATTLDANTIQYLPIETNPTAGRDPLALAGLAPGVIPVSNDNLTNLESGNFNANGQRARSNNITVDNAVATDIVTSEQAGTGTFSLDSLQEFTIITSGVPAEFGRNSGSQVQFITRGGSNEFHGTAYLFAQNSAFNAKDFFSTTGKATPFNQDLWGGTFGGHLIKNRVFVALDYQGLHSSGASETTSAAVLTTAQAAGITDPTSRALYNAVGAPQSVSGTVSNSAPDDIRQYSWSIRFDETFNNGKDLFTERYSTNPVTAVTPALTFFSSTLPNYGGEGTGLNHFINLGYTHTFNPNLVNQVRFQFNRSGSAFVPNTTLSQPYAPVLDIIGLPTLGVSGSFPQSRVENIFQFSDTLSYIHGRHAFKFGGDLFRYEDDTVINQLSRGEFVYTSVAAFQSGSPFEYGQIFGNPARDYRATDFALFGQDDIRVTPTFTVNLGVRMESSGGVSEANNTLANLDPNSQVPLGGGGTGPLGSIDLGGQAYQRTYNWAPRLGAAWNPGGGKLVLRAGYGWIYDFLFLEPVVDLQNMPPYLYELIFLGSQMTGANSYANFAAGTSTAQTTEQASVGTFPSNFVNFGALTPVQQNLRNPLTEQWDVGAEYQIAKDFVLKATYIGSISKYLQVSLPINLVALQNRPAPATNAADEIARYTTFVSVSNGETGTATGPALNNRIDPRFNTVIQVQSTGNSNYEGLQIQAIKRLSRGLSFQAAYTYGHSNDDISDALSVFSTDSNQVQNPTNLASNWGPSDFDVRNRFVLNALFEVPWTKRFNGARGKFLDGWAVDGVFVTQSGLPVTIFSGPRLGITDVALVGGGAVQANGNVADFTPAPAGSAAAAAIPSPCARGVGFSAPNVECTNTSGFALTQPLLGNFGNSGRNQLRLDGLTNMDLGVYKNTRVGEKLTVQFRWETYNLFNHPNFSGFINTLTAPNFGTYNSTATNPRSMQFGLKVIF